MNPVQGRSDGWVKMEKEIPKFIQLRGYINCNVSKEYKKRNGKEYGFHHESVIGCLISECIYQGHAIYNPFIDPNEVIKKAKETKNQKDIENAKKYVLAIKDRFGEFYMRMGINLDSLLS